VLVTARIVDAVQALAAPRARAVIERAIDLSLARDDFRIIHVGMRKTQLELIGRVGLQNYCQSQMK